MPKKTQSGVLCLSLILSSVLLISCQQIDGQSLLTNEAKEDTTHDIDKSAKVDELYLALHAPTINATGKYKVDVSGECFTSTYPRHDIIVTRSGTNGATVDIIDFNTASNANSNTALCRNGRFNFAIRVSNLASGSYSFRVTLRAYDENGATVINDAQGFSALTITK